MRDGFFISWQDTPRREQIQHHIATLKCQKLAVLYNAFALIIFNPIGNRIDASSICINHLFNKSKHLTHFCLLFFGFFVTRCFLCNIVYWQCSWCCVHGINASRRRVTAEALAFALAVACAAARSSAREAGVPPRKPRNQMCCENKNLFNSSAFLIILVREMCKIPPVCKFPTMI